MHLEGSCHCKKVRFELESDLIWPFMWCHCSICRKTAGAGFGCGIKCKKDAFRVTAGQDVVKVYRPMRMKRFFCPECGSHLWGHDDEWPDLLFPNAAAIDTALPTPDRVVHVFVGSKSSWFEILHEGESHDEWPTLSMDEYHARFGWTPAP